MQEEPKRQTGEVIQEPPAEMTGHRSQQEIDRKRVETGRIDADDEVRDEDELENPGQA